MSGRASCMRAIRLVDCIRYFINQKKFSQDFVKFIFIHLLNKSNNRLCIINTFSSIELKVNILKEFNGKNYLHFYKMQVRTHLNSSMLPSVYPAAITDLALEMCFSFPFSSSTVLNASERYSGSSTPRFWDREKKIV
jgi:hypothetical protein